MMFAVCRIIIHKFIRKTILYKDDGLLNAVIFILVNLQKKLPDLEHIWGLL